MSKSLCLFFHSLIPVELYNPALNCYLFTVSLMSYLFLFETQNIRNLKSVWWFNDQFTSQKWVPKICSNYGGYQMTEIRIMESWMNEFLKGISQWLSIWSNYEGFRITEMQVRDTVHYIKIITHNKEYCGLPTDFVLQWVLCITP